MQVDVGMLLCCLIPPLTRHIVPNDAQARNGELLPALRPSALWPSKSNCEHQMLTAGSIGVRPRMSLNSPGHASGTCPSGCTTPPAWIDRPCHWLRCHWSEARWQFHLRVQQHAALIEKRRPLSWMAMFTAVMTPQPLA